MKCSKSNCIWLSQWHTHTAMSDKQNKLSAVAYLFRNFKPVTGLVIFCPRQLAFSVVVSDGSRESGLFPNEPSFVVGSWSRRWNRHKVRRADSAGRPACTQTERTGQKHTLSPCICLSVCLSVCRYCRWLCKNSPTRAEVSFSPFSCFRCFHSLYVASSTKRMIIVSRLHCYTVVTCQINICKKCFIYLHVTTFKNVSKMFYANFAYVLACWTHVKGRRWLHVK